MRQPREKSPGLKILWIWTFGTAAILIANVMRTSIRDFQNVLNAEEQQQQNQQQNDNVVIDDSRVSEERVVED
ncbi:hypothetical protein MtrunA17_Chr3g0089661 [Medicago truncatula]|uniref:Transmembrane protein, putative n=1 Tax=Medicago truncatula TaxID=3880 RepID=G7IX14_MEDTR|nr:transmembrane protein, putative [Medicago truncatula]RHN66322.1 hypothetical protein MtrunA17_Chr3g0089661 [Medicago truncatula]